MALPSWYLTQTITQRKIRNAGTRDPVYGKRLTTTTTVTVTGVFVQPRGSGFEDTTTDSRDTVDATLDLFVTGSEADIQPTDQFQYDSNWWQVQGPVGRQRNTRTGIEYCHVILRRVTG